MQDATIFDQDSELLADVVIADVPCSGYGVIGKKPEIKYRVTPQKQDEIVILQRTIRSKLCEAKRRADLQYLYHCKRRKRREHDVVFE